jgi:ribose transport system substrate-binding protein
MKRRLVTLVACPFAVAALALGATSVSAAHTVSKNAAAAAAAETVIAPYLKVPKALNVTQQLKKIPKGKTVDYLEEPLPIGQEFQVGISAAAAALGMKATTINSGFTPQTMASAWSQVFQSPPSAVVILGTPAAEITPELQQAKAMHIPVVTLFTNDSPYWTDIFGQSGFKLLGKLEADFVIANSGAKANLVDFYEPELPGAAGTLASAVSTVKSGCHACAMATQQLAISGVGSTDPATVVSYLQAHPKVNWVVLGDANDAIGLPAALAQAGIHGIKILTGAGGTVNYAYIKAGGEDADASQSPYYMGWALVDAVARRLANQPVNSGFMPLQFITKKAITWNIQNPWPSVPGYEKKFKKLWGVH